MATKKIDLDKYYTPRELALRLINKTYEVIGVENITEVIEPSAGSGAFSLQIPDCIAYDIKPEHPSIIEMDFFKCTELYKRGRMYIGNPPFAYGSCNTLYKKFYKLCCELGDYVAFVLPISQFANNHELFEFDLLYSEDLGLVTYSGTHPVHCCFNIYKRPSSGWVNKQTKVDSQIYRASDGRCAVVLSGLRRTNDIHNTRNDNPYKHNIKEYDHLMCAWGQVGTPSSRCGEYSKEFGFQVLLEDDADLRERLLEFIKTVNWDDAIGYPNLSNSSRTLSIRVARDYILKYFPELH